MRCCYKDRAHPAALSQCDATPKAYLTLCKCPKTPLDACKRFSNGPQMLQESAKKLSKRPRVNILE